MNSFLRKTKSPYNAGENKTFPPLVSSTLACSCLPQNLYYSLDLPTSSYRTQFHSAVHIVIHQADLVCITKVGTKEVDIAKVRVRRRHINLLRVPTDRDKSWVSFPDIEKAARLD